MLEEECCEVGRPEEMRKVAEEGREEKEGAREDNGGWTGGASTWGGKCNKCVGI